MALNYHSFQVNDVSEYIDIYIYKDSSTEVIPLTTLDLNIEYSEAGLFEPLIITTCSQLVINTSTNFNLFDDLCNNNEKKFRIEVILQKNPSTCLFEGFLSNDIIERELKPHATVNLEWSNYLGKLEDIDCPEFGDGQYVTLLDGIKNLLALTGLDYPIYTNCSLFCTRQRLPELGVDTLFEDIKFSSQLFWTSNIDRVNAKQALISLLKPFGCYLYMYDKKWIIERYDDITAGANDWIVYDFSIDSSAKTSVDSLYTWYHHHQGTFKTILNYPLVQSRTGWSSYRLNLEQKEFITLTPNTWDISLGITSTKYPDSTELDFRKWYICPSIGYNWYGTAHNLWGMANCFEGNYPVDMSSYLTPQGGLYYKFSSSLNEGTRTETNWKPNQLTIKFKGLGMRSLFSGDWGWIYGDRENQSFQFGFTLQKASGAGINSYMFYDGDRWNLQYEPSVNWQSFPVPEMLSNTVDFNQTVLIDDISTYLDYDVSMGGNVSWVLGIQQPTFTCFGRNYVEGGNAWSTFYINNLYVGDVIVSASNEPTENVYDVILHEGFFNKGESKIELYDTKNLNYRNGLQIGDLRTQTWYDFYDTSTYNLASIFMRTQHSYYQATRQGTSFVMRPITTDMVKPLSIITFPEVLGEDGYVAKQLLKSYNYIPAENSYEVKTYEYVSPISRKNPKFLN